MKIVNHVWTGEVNYLLVLSTCCRSKLVKFRYLLVSVQERIRSSFLPKVVLFLKVVLFVENPRTLLYSSSHNSSSTFYKSSTNVETMDRVSFCRSFSCLSRWMYRIIKFRFYKYSLSESEFGVKMVTNRYSTIRSKT